MRLLEGLALLELHRPEESVRAFSDAVTAADTLLAAADRNVAALQVRALALSGLAAAAGDPDRAIEAGEAFARADTVTTAAGVAADTRRLFDQIACRGRRAQARVRDHDRRRRVQRHPDGAVHLVRRAIPAGAPRLGPAAGHRRTPPPV
jgi:hypothetical protein